MLKLLIIYAAFVGGTAAGITTMCLLQIGREHE